ncbi:MAG: ATP-binding cassette domain-containing protein [Anaerolineaceae bacterium]|nr:ATP-binding cassette domain-containing protein [Anaerolineaceae bacterium]
MGEEQVIFSMVGVSKVFPPSQKAVIKNISLGFFYGAKIGVLGLNGSGKSTLLKIIAQHSPDDVVIEDIKQDGQHIVITGVALRAELSNQLATKIEQPLAAMGWKVSEPNSHSLDTFGKDQGPWEFDLIIEDLGLKGFLNSPKP